MFSIPYRKIYSSKFLLDFLNGDSATSNFIPTATNIEDFKELILEKDFPLENRKILCSTISKQYENSGIAAPNHLDKLLDANSFTVTTGHQLCLFGGPQFFIHKIVSAISLANQLKLAYPESNFIPIFWMASEDHDFDEIASVSIFNKEIKVNGVNKHPVGRIKTLEFSSALKELKSFFMNDSSGNHLISIFEEAFSKSNWADCTRFWVDKLFSKYGLIVLDADAKELKTVFRPTLELEIKQQFVYNAVVNTNNSISKEGYSPKINPRKLNLFYFNKGNRERIISNEGVFLIGDLTYSKDQILKMIELNPENFSPNVLLRPLYQESILPNLAYIGGPAEIQYWGQLKEAFDFSNVDFPMVILRDHFGWINNSDLTWWKSKGLNESDLFLDYDELVKKILIKDNVFSLNVEDHLQAIKSSILKEIHAVDTSIESMLIGELQKFKNGINKIESKLTRSSKRNNEIFYKKVKKVQDSLMINGNLNERKEGFIPLYITLGDQYLSFLLEAANPLKSELKILEK